MVPVNKLREILNKDGYSISTRIESTWPIVIEVIGKTRIYDFIEYVAEYSPFNQSDLEVMAITSEYHNLGSMIKVDFQNRFYVAQKALASGFQSVLLTDHKTPDEVRETIYMLKPDTPEDEGRFGYPNRRWIGYNPYNSQLDYAKMVRNTVIAVMIEKKQAMDNLEDICNIPGVDIVQFGPSDYALSCGKNNKKEETDAVEREMINIALKNKVAVRCQINTAEEGKYYYDLGVKHFCLGDELRNNMVFWASQGEILKDMLK